MPKAAAVHRAYPQQGKRVDRRANSMQRGYDTQWKKFSAWFKRQPEHCLCVTCLREGKTVPAEHTDHIIPLVDAPELKYEMSNLQGLCASCHSKKTATENGGFGNMTNNGVPI